ncbi:MAG TPA: helix-turn-helix domain-containing protein [Kofleriaceae bacterium]|nr:helix-turn-helix domain-containing protein [Kofleriaceae bacterium]
MSLFDEHKAERKDRILAAARKLIVKHGYDGLTMRELARAARVSVPTLYNLFGSKDAILVAELEAAAARMAAKLPRTGDSFFERGMVAFEAGMQLIEEAPEFFRAAMRMFLTSPETGAIRRRIEDGFIAVMAANLDAAKRAGQLAPWAVPAVAARHMFAHHMACFLAWGIGELDLKTFRAASLSGLCHLLAGVARGRFAEEAVACIQALTNDESLHSYMEVRHAWSGRD